ncbi:hypothetical protein [Streptosporangium sp. H16]|uniref:hypothetical protein n=1 Tax=Streptosporangium sp. H16 TaxID=3444184 RepID=UPI003F79809D
MTATASAAAPDDGKSRARSSWPLKTPAKAATLGKFKLRLAHLQALDELGATEQRLDGIRLRYHRRGERPGW